MPRPRIPSPTMPVTTRLPPETVEALRVIAAVEERTVSQVIARLLRDHLYGLGRLPAPQGEVER
jgi:hypothetical protein